MTNSITKIKLQLKIKNKELHDALKDYDESVRSKKDHKVSSRVVNKINKIKAEITELTSELNTLESL